MDPKAEPCFYLISGNDHSSNCCKILVPSGVASYSTDVVWGYRRVPFVGEIATWGGGAIRTSEVLKKGISASQVEEEETEEEIVVVRTSEAAALSRELREETTSSPESGGGGTEEAGDGVTKGVGDVIEEDGREG